MKAEGYKILTHEEVCTLLAKKENPVIQDALQSNFDIIDSIWHYWDDGSNDCTMSDKYRILYWVEAQFSDN